MEQDHEEIPLEPRVALALSRVPPTEVRVGDFRVAEAAELTLREVEAPLSTV